MLNRDPVHTVASILCIECMIIRSKISFAKAYCYTRRSKALPTAKLFFEVIDKKQKKRLMKEKRGEKLSKTFITSSLLLLIYYHKKEEEARREYYTHIRTIKMTREDDLYRALGLERTASQEEIRKAYKTTGNE